MRSSRRSGRPKAFLVSQWFPPEPAAQALRAAGLLKASGYEVEVLTGIPNYPSGVVADGYRATQLASEYVSGFRVNRTPLYPSHDASAIRRILNYTSWALSAAIFGAWRLRRADVVLVYSSPATAALPAMIARWLFKTPYVLLVQDVWPDSVFASGFLKGRAEKMARRIIESFVNSSYRWAGEVLVISPGMVNLLEARGVSSAKLTLIYNTVDVSQLDGAQTHISRQALGIDDGDLVLMYAGNHGAAQDLDTLIEAVGRSTGLQRDVHLIMVGDGMLKKHLQDRADRLAGGRVHFVDPQPRETMASLMNVADVQVISLADEPLFKVTMPSKMQASLATAKPVLAIAGGDVADVVSLSACGIAAPPANPDAVVASIETFAQLTADELALMGRAGRTYYEEHMTDTVALGRVRRVLARVSKTPINHEAGGSPVC